MLPIPLHIPTPTHGEKQSWKLAPFHFYCPQIEFWKRALRSFSHKNELPGLHDVPDLVPVSSFCVALIVRSNGEFHGERGMCPNGSAYRFRRIGLWWHYYHQVIVLKWCTTNGSEWNADMIMIAFGVSGTDYQAFINILNIFLKVSCSGKRSKGLERKRGVMKNSPNSAWYPFLPAVCFQVMFRSRIQLG